MLGEVAAIRPHKGGLAGQPARLFVARWRKNAEGRIQNVEFKPAHCVVTEGEFKALALHWVFEGRAGVAALPGIQQGRNYTVLEELKEWLHDDCAPEKIVVAFDSEEKGDPKLPGFKPEKGKRFDAEVYARYLAIKLEQSFCAARVCHLPKSWRNANGKADWDGGPLHPVRIRPFNSAGRAQDEQFKRQEVRARFSETLAGAMGTREFKQASGLHLTVFRLFLHSFQFFLHSAFCLLPFPLPYPFLPLLPSWQTDGASLSSFHDRRGQELAGNTEGAESKSETPPPLENRALMALREFYEIRLPS